MLKCIIVDDEVLAREELKFLLSDYEYVNIEGEASSGLEALDLANELIPNLVFLDINMPGISGIRVAEKLLNMKQPPKVIFTTAHDKYAIDAFEVNAIDYLLKPISQKRLSQALEKILGESRDNTNLDKDFLDEQMKDEAIDRLYVEKNGRFLPLELEEVIYFTIVDKKTMIHSDKGIFEYAHSLSYIEEKLNRMKYLRTHRGYLVNISAIEEIEPWFNNTYMLKMRNSEEKVPVARSQVKIFKKMLGL